MPTLSNDAWVSAGSGGDRGDVVPRRRSDVLAFVSRLPKKDVIEGWYCRLRMWPVDDVVVAIAACLEIRGRRGVVASGHRS